MQKKLPDCPDRGWRKKEKLFQSLFALYANAKIDFFCLTLGQH